MLVGTISFLADVLAHLLTLLMRFWKPGGYRIGRVERCCLAFYRCKFLVAKQTPEQRCRGRHRSPLRNTSGSGGRLGGVGSPDPVFCSTSPTVISQAANDLKPQFFTQLKVTMSRWFSYGEGDVWYREPKG